MNKKISVLLFIFSLALFAACDKKTTANKTSTAQPEVQKNAMPVPDNEVAVIEMEEPAYGTIKIELYSNIAPKAVARFKELAREGYYNGIAFHRINQSVIQAGNSDTKPGAQPSGMREGDSGKPNVEAEFSDIPYDAGIVGAARLGNDFNSANSQFFITLRREAGFDNKYTVFGKVVEGMNSARTIAGAPKEGERPLDPIRIKQVTIQPR
jgi:cyclophilin family peptidyl-prolyl cis-trans isomerase